MNFKLLSALAITTVAASSVNVESAPFSQKNCAAAYNGALPQSYSLVPLKCFIATKPGKCRAAFPSWNFEIKSGVGKCVKSEFGGCPDGCTAFLSKEECESSCHYVAFLVANSKPAQFEQPGCKVESPTPLKPHYKDMPATCFISTKPSICRGFHQSFHYDPTTKKCVQSVFGGCDDGCQAYKSMESCQASCVAPFGN